jgi:DNA-binding HxlR family transcriptional regulator
VDEDRPVRPDDADLQACLLFQKVVEHVGRRWTGAILLAASRGARRFGEYRRMVDGISDRLLAQRLKELEALGVIERKVVPSTPVQIYYYPTARGTELIAILQPLMGRGARHGIAAH